MYLSITQSFKTVSLQGIWVENQLRIYVCTLACALSFNLNLQSKTSPRKFRVMAKTSFAKHFPNRITQSRASDARMLRNFTIFFTMLPISRWEV